MRTLIFTLFVFVAFFACAAMRTVIGYGTGDTLEQALIMAQGDAVLNAGGKVTSVEKLQGDVLISDRGISSNELFVTEYKILEEGESFDGVSARIEAKVCNISERQFEDGKDVLGEGSGTSKRLARLAAIGNAMSRLGVGIRAIGEYEGDLLVRDETEAFGWAYVSSIEELEKSCRDGRYESKVKVKTFSCKAESGIGRNFLKETSGKGDTLLGAVNNARSRAFLGLPASYAAKTTYESGEYVSRSIRQNWQGVCFGAEILNSQSVGDAWNVKLLLKLNESGDANFAVGVSPVSGLGIANDRKNAIEDAKRDALLNAGSAVEASVAYDEGKDREPFVVERVRFRSVGYVGLQSVVAQSVGDTVSAQIDAKVSHERARDWECRLDKAVAEVADGDVYSSYLVARFESFVNAGALYDVERAYENGHLLTDTCSITSERENCGFSFEKVRDGEGGNAHAVRVEAYGLSGGEVSGKTAFGIGFGETGAVAFELAKNDAVVNASAKVSVKGQYDKYDLKEIEQQFVGRAFVGEVSIESALERSRGHLVCAKAHVSGSQSEAYSTRPHRVDYETSALTVDAAIARAHRGLLMKAGATATVLMRYKGDHLEQSDAEYRSQGRLSDCKIRISRDAQGMYLVHASGKIFDPEWRSDEAKVRGFGFGRTFSEARENAIACAILNSNGAISGEERYEMGVLKSGRSRCEGDGYLFAVALEECVPGEEGCFVRVQCTYAGESGKLSSGRKTVKAVGWGESEAVAKIDAERNAIDSVFGRRIFAMMAEDNGVLTEKRTSNQAFCDGYVEETKVEEARIENGLHIVKIKTVVCQKDVEDSTEVDWLVWAVWLFIFTGIVGVVREKVGKRKAVAVGLIIAFVMLLAGLWIPALLMTILGLGAAYNEN